MEYRTLELNLTSAKVLKDVNRPSWEEEDLFSEMGLYVVVSLPGNNEEFKTPVDRSGGTDPEWNFPIKFTFEESLLQQDRLTLQMKLCYDHHTETHIIGEVHVSLSQLVDLNTPENLFFNHVSYLLREQSSGCPKGILDFFYKFGEKFTSRVKNFPTPSPGARYPRPRRDLLQHVVEFGNPSLEPTKPPTLLLEVWIEENPTYTLGTRVLKHLWVLKAQSFLREYCCMRYEESFKFRAILLDLTAIVTIWVRGSEQKVGPSIVCVAFSSFFGNFQDSNNSGKATYFAAFVPLPIRSIRIVLDQKSNSMGSRWILNSNSSEGSNLAS
ncbi:Protein SRC2 [Glycine soja]|uniref:Protein SRC2 n=1 Tax=Glycine soja TaxID=3848 RepID=A0A445JY42_GLYSO|nr:Protein SRC2 [Glycine soja]